MTANTYEAAELKQAASLINSDLFAAFLKEDADRFLFIFSWLKNAGVPVAAVEMTNGKHLVVRYKPEAYNRQFKMKTFVAHYDRAKGTQGANDNSLACFILMLFAKELLNFNGAHNVKIIFTDSEEAGAEGISMQGSYKLALGLRKLNAADEDIFVFDMCGRGDVLILSQAGLFGRKNTQSLEKLHKKTCGYAESVCPGKWFSLLTPYSDNAGFIAAGLNAQVITVLPRTEAETLLKAMPEKTLSLTCRSVLKTMKKIPSVTENTPTALQTLTGLIIKNEKPEKNSTFFSIIPKTWQYMHTAEDTKEKLTPEAVILIRSFLKYLAKSKTPYKK